MANKLVDLIHSRLDELSKENDRQTEEIEAMKDVLEGMEDALEGVSDLGQHPNRVLQIEAEILQLAKMDTTLIANLSSVSEIANLNSELFMNHTVIVDAHTKIGELNTAAIQGLDVEVVALQKHHDGFQPALFLAIVGWVIVTALVGVLAWRWKAK